MHLNHWLASAFLVGIGATALGACNGSELVLPNEGVAARIEMIRGNAQSATVTAALPESLVVRVLDSRGRPVVGQRVDFAAAAGAGALSPASPATDADGEAAAQWVLGPTTGAQSGTARPVGNGAPADLVVTFSATATASRAARVVKLAGDGQSATAGTAVAVSPSVRVFDANDNPVDGVPVTFAVVSGGGSVSPTSPVSTNADGVAAATSWTLGPAAGPNSLTATVGGSSVTGSPVTFQATGTVGSANRLVFSGQPVNAAVGAPITPPVQVQVQDAAGNVIPDAAVQVTITLGSNPGGATLSGQTTVTPSQGTATFANLRLSAPGTGYTLRALASGLTDATSTTFDVVSGASRTEITDIRPSSTVVGQLYTVEFRVTAVAPATGTPGGPVTVSDGAGATCQAQVAAGSCSLASTTRGVKRITATYPGDASFAGSASEPENHSVNAASTTLQIQQISPEPSLFGQPFTVRVAVTVNAPGSGQLDGVVNVTYQGGGNCSVPVTAVPLQCAITPASAGTNRDVTAQYVSASGNFAGDSDTDEHTVRPVNTTTTVTSSDASSEFGEPVFFTAAVAPEPGGGQPTGTVQFKVDGSSFGSDVTLNGGNARSQTTSTLAPGTHEVRAIYNASSGFGDSEGTTTQTVTGLIPTNTTLSDPGPSTYGQAVQFTATVTSIILTPTGTVRLHDGGSCGTPGPELDSGSLSSGGSVSLTAAGAELAGGSHTLLACYQPNNPFEASSDTRAHTVNPAGTVTSIESTNSPTDQFQDIVVAYEVSASAGTPLGTVIVRLAGTAESCSGSVAAGSCTIPAPFGGFAQGEYQVTGEYTGSSDHAGSVSEPTRHTVVGIF